MVFLTQATYSAAQGARRGDDEARRRLIGELIVACAAGDRAAFRRLYELSSSQVFGVLVAMLRDRQSAADVAQEVYVAVWRNAASFRPERGSALAWLMTIARNRAIDRLRADRARGLSAPIDDFPHLVAQRAAGRERGRRARAAPGARRAQAGSPPRAFARLLQRLYS